MAEENKAERVQQLVEEGEFAADYLEEFLDIVNLDGDLVLDVENDRALVDIVSEDGAGDLERLVGEDGEVLDALQELTRLAVQARTGERSRLMLDIAGFRADRRRELAEITEEAIIRVRTYGEPVMLESMNPFERKVCHDVIATAGLASESEGVEPNRCVVVLPAAAPAADAEAE
ncbi:MAG: R3H domain-containing nucleic acid-binding protein [Actinomycetaceae bacterium]|nr:R3H domain-containing nucleic acid-binding protein [Actinomycetaceae bacterium]